MMRQSANERIATENYVGNALCAVCQAGRHDQLALSADVHGSDTFVPAFDDPPSSQHELKRLLANTNAVTPEIQKTLAEAAQLRADCQKEMLQHFYDVSRTMPPEQGKRYLAWVQRSTVLSDSHKDMHH